MAGAPLRWQAPGNAKGFNTFIGNTQTKIKSRINANNRTIGTLKYIKEMSNESGFISEEQLTRELKKYLYRHFLEEQTDSLVTHFYKPALFYGLISRDKNYNLSLSIEGNLFVNYYDAKEFQKAKEVLINQLDNTTYPNSATPGVKELKLFPFRILFKLLLENEKLSADFLREKLIYIVSKESLSQYEKSENLVDIKQYSYYDKFYTWVVNSLVDVEILDSKNNFVSINSDVLAHINSLYKNLSYSDMFFESASCELNSSVADKRVKRDASLIIKAKERDMYKCVIDSSHKTFISKSHPYVEGHHVIPMYQQKNYSFALDDVDNIVSLCPNCHREIHSSDDKTAILNRVYEVQKGYMKAHQIELSELYKMYACLS